MEYYEKVNILGKQDFLVKKGGVASKMKPGWGGGDAKTGKVNKASSGELKGEFLVPMQSVLDTDSN